MKTVDQLNGEELALFDTLTPEQQDLMLKMLPTPRVSSRKHSEEFFQKEEAYWLDRCEGLFALITELEKQYTADSSILASAQARDQNGSYQHVRLPREFAGFKVSRIRPPKGGEQE